MPERPDFQVRGEWDSEPEREDFDHAELACLILRGRNGALCGYAGVPPAHPLYEPQMKKVDWGTGELDVTFYKLGDYLYEQNANLDVDINYSEMGDGALRPVGFHWFGFDCNHLYDYAPPTDPVTAKLRGEFGDLYPGPFKTYRNWAYVKGEVQRLAEQLAAMMPMPSHSEWLRQQQEPADGL